MIVSCVITSLIFLFISLIYGSKLKGSSYLKLLVFKIFTYSSNVFNTYCLILASPFLYNSAKVSIFFLSLIKLSNIGLYLLYV